MNDNRLKVGMVSVMQHNFTGDKKAQFDKGRAGMGLLSEKLNYDFYCYPEMIVTADEAKKAATAILAEGVNFLVVQSASFAAGELIVPLAKTGLPLGLWAVPEPRETGVLGLNSFCCINMYASIIKNYLKEHKIKYKWFFGYPGEKVFDERFTITIKALGAIVKMRKSKVALIGGIAPGFNDLYFDERLAEARLGVEIKRNHEFSEIKQMALRYSKDDLKDAIDEVKKGYAQISAKVLEGIEINARVYKAYKDFAAENGYDALAISCWPKIQDELGFLACSTLAKLNQNGIPAACEGDLPGVVSMLMLKYITDDVTMLMDLVAYDEADDTVEMWHCGPAAECYANKNGVCLDCFYENGGNGTYLRRASIHNLDFKAQPVSIMRITGEWNKIFIADGSFIDNGKKTFIGSSGWLGQLRLNGIPAGAADFINTIMATGFQHHYPIVSGIITDILMEVAVWLGLKTVDTIPLKPYIQLEDYD